MSVEDERRTRPALSVRTHILLIVFGGAILPLALIGLWLTRSAVRSGEQLLQSQLDSSVATISNSVKARWYYRRGDLLLLSENNVARRVLAAQRFSAADSTFLAQLANDIVRTIPSVEYRDSAGLVRWSSSADIAAPSNGLALTQRRTPSQPAGPTIAVVLTIRDSLGAALGTLNARVRLDALLPSDSGRFAVPGSSLGVRDHTSGTILMPVAGTESVPAASTLVVAGAPWRAAHASLDDPPLDFVIAAPTAAYVLPFERSGRAGLVALALVTAVALVLSAFLTSRLTQSLQRLVTAASAVSQGTLDRRVETDGPREVGTLAAAFNTMTDSLRRTLDELSRRSALAAVGQFAASLAHEVRNALTSVKVDLQRAEQKLTEQSPSRELVSRTLTSVTRLNAAVTGALRVARSGSLEPQPVDVQPILAAAAESAAPAFAESASTIELALPVGDALRVSGDADSLEQLFLNLMLNAAQSLGAGGRTLVTAVVEDGALVVSIADNGSGMDQQRIEHVAEPFFTTRAGGTGLGLPIARQIAIAHGGSIAIESELGRGTTVRVKLPRRAS